MIARTEENLKYLERKYGNTSAYPCDVGKIEDFQKTIKNQDPEKPAYKKYFMHGTSHQLGLDTHDYGLMDQPLKANMVLTVEPGIYIPEEGFGIRIEDDVVIQEKGPPVDLTKNIPKEPDEIEHLMQKSC